MKLSEIEGLKRLQREATVDLRPGDDGAINARDDAAGEALPRLLQEREMLLGALETLLHADPGSADCNHAACRGARAAIKQAES